MWNSLGQKAIKLAKVIKNAEYRRALQQGVAAGIEHERLLKNLQCRTVVDIGGNRGQFALVARHCFPLARINSFEPLPEPARLFRVVFAGDDKTVLHPIAIGPHRTTATIHISAHDDSSSLLPISSLQASLFPGTAERGTETIQVEPLSARMSRADLVSPALLKVDVQGYELRALEGCADLLSCFAYVYVECSYFELYVGQALADEVIGFLQKQGFQLKGIYNMTYDREGRAVQADFFFTACGHTS